VAHGAERATREGPRVTAATASEVEALRDRFRDAAAAGAPLRIVGGGTWLDAGRPVPNSDAVSMRAFDGITEYVPGDLTLTARGGTTLAEIRDATAAHGQWLALDPHGSDEGTIGATVATASAGPLVTTFGAPRDLMLGLEFVTATGAIVRGGGRVVKNVAGFDLTRLVTGSWGTLGAITEVSVRLHARPAVDESVSVSLDDGNAGVERVRTLLRRLPFTPYACEVVNAHLSRALGLGDAPAVIVRLGGNADAVRAQRGALNDVGTPRPADPMVWARLRTCEPAGAITIRLSALPSRLEGTWREAARLTTSCLDAMIHATPTRGVVRCIVPRSTSAIDALERALSTDGGVKRVGERLPPALWRAFAPPANDRVSRGIKATFDPADVLNRGILGASA